MEKEDFKVTPVVVPTVTIKGIKIYMSLIYAKSLVEYLDYFVAGGSITAKFMRDSINDKISDRTDSVKNENSYSPEEQEVLNQFEKDIYE